MVSWVALVLVSLLLLSSLGLGCFSQLTLFEFVGAAPAGPGHFQRKCLEAPGRLASLLLFLFVVVPPWVDKKKKCLEVARVTEFSPGVSVHGTCEVLICLRFCLCWWNPISTFRGYLFVARWADSSTEVLPKCKSSL